MIDEYLDAKADGDFGEGSAAAADTLYLDLNIDGPEEEGEDDADMDDEDDIDAENWGDDPQDGDDIEGGDTDQEQPEKLLDKTQIEKASVQEKVEPPKEQPKKEKEPEEPPKQPPNNPSSVKRVAGTSTQKEKPAM